MIHQQKGKKLNFTISFVTLCNIYRNGAGLGFFRKKPISSRTPGRNWKKLEESGLFRKKVEEIGIK